MGLDPVDADGHTDACLQLLKEHQWQKLPTDVSGFEPEVCTGIKRGSNSSSQRKSKKKVQVVESDVVEDEYEHAEMSDENEGEMYTHAQPPTR